MCGDRELKAQTLGVFAKVPGSGGIFFHEFGPRAPGSARTDAGQGLQHVLEADPAIVCSRLVGALSPEKLCSFVLGTIFTSLMEGSDCETLFALLAASLYEAVAESVASGSVAAAPIEKKDC